MILTAYSKDKSVTGYDVYVAGFEYNGSIGVAKVWKNDSAQGLTNGTREKYP